MSMSLKSQTLSGVKWTSLSSLLGVLIQLIKFAVLARLIAKTDFGLFATVSVVLGLADQFVEAGLGSAVIHKQNATKIELGTAYVINLILGCFIFPILFLTATPIANFYGETILSDLLRLTAIIFLIQPFGRQYDALLRKSFLFKKLALINIASGILSLFLAVQLAYAGHGVYALIYSHIAQVVVRTFLLMLFGINAFGFNFAFSTKSARFFLKFGIYQIGDTAINYFNSQLDTILIGKLLGQESLGIFYMAKQIAMRPVSVINPIITNVSLPLFAKIQNDVQRLKNAYLKIVNSIAEVQFAVYFIMAGFSTEIINIFLGNNWSGIENIFMLFCLNYMIVAVGNPIGSLLCSLGKADVGFYWNLSVLLYSPLIIISSSKYGMIGVAFGILLIRIVAFLLGCYFLIFKFCKATFVEYNLPLLKVLLNNFICFSFLFLNINLIYKISFFVLSLLIYLKYLIKNIKLVVR